MAGILKTRLGVFYVGHIALTVRKNDILILALARVMGGLK